MLGTNCDVIMWNFRLGCCCCCCCSGPNAQRRCGSLVSRVYEDNHRTVRQPAGLKQLATHISRLRNVKYVHRVSSKLQFLTWNIRIRGLLFSYTESKRQLHEPYNYSFMKLQLWCRVWKQQIACADISSKELQFAWNPVYGFSLLHVWKIAVISCKCSFTLNQPFKDEAQKALFNP